MPPVLEYERIVKRYGGPFSSQKVTALDDFSLTVNRGEILGFLGPNGAGKSTSIHLAMGFMRPTSGSGRLLGKPFGDAATRRRIGFLAENVALYHRKAAKVVHFYGALNGMRDPHLSRAVRDVLDTLELNEVRDRNVGKFSRGMMQRVGLAQALVNDPEFLVLDEPTSALDPLGRVAVRELLLRARASGKTIFLSSHLLSEIESVCDRIAIVNRGASCGRERRVNCWSVLTYRRSSRAVLMQYRLRARSPNRDTSASVSLPRSSALPSSAYGRVAEK